LISLPHWRGTGIASFIGYGEKSMNHLRFLLAFLVVLGSYGMSSGQDQQQPPQQSQPQQPQYAREWTGLIPGYQQPAGVEPQHGVMTEVRASRNRRPSDAQFMTQAPVLGPDGKPLPGQFTAIREGQTRPGRSIVTPSISPSSGNADRSPATSSGAIHAPQRNPSQVVGKIPGLGQTGVKPMAGEKVVGKDAPLYFNEYGAQLPAGMSQLPQRGQQINPQNLYPPFTAPLPKPEPHDLIMYCGVQGRSADVIAGRCM
jgi:hypothetical protein